MDERDNAKQYEVPQQPGPVAPATPQETEENHSGGLGRRALLGAAGAGIAAAGIGGYALGRSGGPDVQDPVTLRYDYRGQRQSGILTPAQDYMFTAAYDLRTTSREQLIDLLGRWSVAAEQMMAGDLVGGEPLANRQAPPVDTGEAWGYPPSGLTITFGFGGTLFQTTDGQDRFGIADKMPQVLKDGTPRFANEALRPEECDGDLLIQACSNDAQVAMHAVRNMTRIAFGTARLRWSQMGYGRTSSTTVQQETPRNLFGFKDGTNNLKVEAGDETLNKHLWVAEGDDPAADWLAGGTYYAARKIRMLLEIWDRLRLVEQEEVIGRDKRHGAPLNVPSPHSKDEFHPVGLEEMDEEGSPVIPMDAHVRLVSPSANNGSTMLRRGYNYTNGNDSLGRINAGLFFIAFVRDPRKDFFPVLRRMTNEDALTEYIQHHASALFAIPPGMGTADTFVGQKLFS
ncbi:deferrochelatase/peroxidase EfeB [Dermabacteraceae bacterium TAE3-ERU27]|nr:deferrochelatase/peroxidase EfeB [Dermabacteraceae bacterium TAE3-ERU27]